MPTDGHYYRFEPTLGKCLHCRVDSSQSLCPRCEFLFSQRLSTDNPYPGYPFSLNKDGNMVISWFEYYLLINQLIAVLESKKLGFNQVIGLTRGGFRPAEQVARAFKVNLALLGVES